MVREDLRKTPDFVKGVVQRSRRDTNHVRLTEIAFYTRGDKFLMYLLWMLVRLDRQLRAAFIWVRWSDDREFL